MGARGGKGDTGRGGGEEDIVAVVVVFRSKTIIRGKKWIIDLSPVLL
jgi:hypothetical protein